MRGVAAVMAVMAASVVLLAIGCSGDDSPDGSGVQHWETPIERPLGLVLGPDVVVVAGTSTLAAFDVATGDARWDREIEPAVARTPMSVDGDIVVIARPAGRSLAFSLADGEPVDGYRGPVPAEVTVPSTPEGYTYHPGPGELRYEGRVVMSGFDSVMIPGVIGRVDGFTILSRFDRLLVIADDGEVALDHRFDDAASDESGWAVDPENRRAAAWLADGNLHVLQL